MRRVVLVFILILLCSNKVCAEELSYEDIIEHCNEYDYDGTSRFASKRLIVKGDLTDSYGAIEVIEVMDNYYILQYSSVSETIKAYYQLCNKYIVSVDEILNSVSEGCNVSFPDSSADEMNLGELYEKSKDKARVNVLLLGTGWDSSYNNNQRVVDKQNFVTFDDYGVYCTNHESTVGTVILDNTPENIKIYSIRVQGGDSKASQTTTLSISLALNYALENNIDVVNVSFTFNGGMKYNVIEDDIDKLMKQGIIVVAATGNNGEDISQKDGYYVYPASYEPVWAVGSINKDKTVSHFSNSCDSIDFVGYGDDIKLSTQNELVSGTSYSCPYITSMVAMLKAIRAYSTPEEAYNLVKGYCVDLVNTGWDNQSGWGIPVYSCSTEKEDADNEECISGYNHNWELALETEPTCMSDGVKVYLCKNCNKERREYKQALGHSLKREIISPTCTEAGYFKYNCLNEGCNYKDEVIYSNPLGHTKVTIEETKATCSTKGFRKYKCSRCGITGEEVLEKDTNNHTHTTEEIVQATCTREGLKTTTCLDCGKVLSTEKIPVKEHQYKVLSIIDPTTKEDGSVTVRCELCGDTYTQAIPKVEVEIKLEDTSSKSKTTNKDAEESEELKQGSYYTKDSIKNSIYKVKVKKNKVTLKGKFVPYTYVEIKYSNKKNMSESKVKAIKLKGTARKRYISLKLKRKKTYYIQLRYKEFSDGHYYVSKSWSKVKKIKTK